MLAAIFTNGKVVTGGNHGICFAQLSAQEKESFTSGFYDSQTSKFISDDCELYVKEIIILRHGQSEGYTNSPISDVGKQQATDAANFISKQNLFQFKMLCSPIKRCSQTAEIISSICHIQCETNEKLTKKSDSEEQDKFVERISEVFKSLPPKIIIVSHSDFIAFFVQKATGSLVGSIDNCSVYYINNQKLLWCHK